MPLARRERTSSNSRVTSSAGMFAVGSSRTRTRAAERRSDTARAMAIAVRSLMVSWDTGTLTSIV